MGFDLGSTSLAFGRRFSAPDVGLGKTPYACTFHWFRLSDGCICGIDIIRGDDTGQLGLRVFVVAEDGTIRRLVRVAPARAWGAFVTGSRPDVLRVGEDALGRGPGWIAGHARVDGLGSGIREVRFDLQVEPETSGIGTSTAALSLLYLGFQDFRRARTTGTIILDGERHLVDGSGPCSVHFGERLPEYAYMATVPRGASRASDFLLASAAGDNVRYVGGLLGNISLTYAYRASEPIPHVRLGDHTQPVRIGGDRLQLDAVVRTEYQLFGRTTVTGTARAAMVSRDGARSDLGRLVFDYHGDRYVERAPRGVAVGEAKAVARPRDLATHPLG